VKEINIPFAFEIDGHAIDPANMEDPQESAVLESIVDSVTDRVADLRCAEHDEPPRFLLTGPSVEALQLEVLGCCDALVEQVRKKLAD
jgi:hypothetical protein